MNLKGKHVLVLGMGETGMSMTKWLLKQQAVIRIADTRAAPPNLDTVLSILPAAVVFTGAIENSLFDDIDMIAMSPGIALSEPFVQRAVARSIPIVGDITLFNWALKQHGLTDTKVLAITGTNGKTTVTALAGAMLKQAGLDVAVAGNIGPAVLDMLMQYCEKGRVPQVWVLEVSSFQLELTDYLNADVAAVLNVSEDHLDRYSGVQDYVTAKARIFLHDGHSDAGVQVLNRDDAHCMRMQCADSRQVTFGLSEPATDTDFGIIEYEDGICLVEGRRLLMKESELRLNGRHNTANALAALAVCRSLEVPVEPLLYALRDFKGLPHRMEMVAAFCDVTFVDDSKSTNVGSTVAALNGTQGNVVLIAGGEGKGQDFSLLRRAVMDGARAVVLIGRDADKIAAALERCGVPVKFAQSMEDALQQSYMLAHPGDMVLLSPACASFDMFRNYIHRAEVFIAAVKDIEMKFLTFGRKGH